MLNEVVKQKNFQERMMERIRGSIGELMTDGELKKIVEKGMDQVFFQETIERINDWTTKKHPPFIHALIKELLIERMDILIREYLKIHYDEINDIVGEIVQGGVGKALFKALDNQFNIALVNLQDNIENQLRSNNGT